MMKEAVTRITGNIMNDTTTNLDHFAYSSTTRRHAAELRGTRRAIVIAILSATAFAGSALYSVSQSMAGQNADGVYTMAYADPAPERFGIDPAAEAYAEEEHELNDAWMGMTVVSADGVALGYVTDAFVNEDGSIDEIVVEPGDRKGPLDSAVYVPARFAELGATQVSLTVDSKVAAGVFAPAYELAFNTK